MPARPAFRLRHRAPLAVALALALGAATAGPAGCGGSDERVTVLAASSLTDAFAAVEAAYEAEHPGVDVVVSYGGSSSLAAQIGQGVPADVFAAADIATMDRALSAVEGADRPMTFARNRLAIAVAEGNPERITGLADLARDDLVVVIAAPEVPAGQYAIELLAAAGVRIEPASLEQNVRAVASKVALGEADAGIVYSTDIAAQPDRLDAVPIETETADGDVPEYPIAALTPEGRTFVAFVTGAAGQTILADAGFGAP